MSIRKKLDDFWLEEFSKNLAEAMNVACGVVLDADTNFRELEVWDSITLITILAMIFDEYDVQISGNEMRDCESVADLAECVHKKIGA